MLNQRNKHHLKANACFLNIALVMFLGMSEIAAQNGISNDLKNFFNKIGAASNTTAPSSHKDQAAGYYTGGSLTARTGVRSAQLATVQMPGFRGGCGGIDLWTGGFSHINSAQINAMIKNIGSSATSYALMLGMHTISPVVMSTINEIHAIANQVNQTNINSCEAAATLLGGVWPKSDQSSKHLCQAMGTNLGKFSDYAAARQGCGAKGNRQEVINEYGNDARYKDMFVGEFNLAWKAIQANSFLSSSPELGHLFLTLVGSIIVKKNGEHFEVKNLPSHADRDAILKGLMEGGNISLYVCDTEKCLNPTLQNVMVQDVSALLKRTQNTLNTLVTKIYDDTPLTLAEKAFLNATRLPVFKMLNVVTAYRKGFAPVDIQQYGELIALDILHKYVLEVIDIVHDSVVQLQAVQVDEAHMERFLKQLRDARTRILQKRQSAYQQMDSTLSFIQATQLIEKQLHTMMGSLVDEHL